MQKAEPRLIPLVKTKSHKPNKRQRCTARKQSLAAAVSNPYCEDKPSNPYCEDTKEETGNRKHTRSDDAGCIWPPGLKPKAKPNAQSDESDDDTDEANPTHGMSSTPGICNAAKLECPCAYKPRGVTEGDDIEDGTLKQLSHNMAVFLRHTAYKEGLLSEGDWLPMSVALHHLQCNEAEVVQAAKLSDRSIPYPSGARFEVWISGSMTWIRATDGEHYRQLYRRRAARRAARRSWMSAAPL